MKITYHAWLAERIGKDSEVWDIPQETSVALLIQELSEACAHKRNVFSQMDKVYIAHNQHMIQKSTLSTTMIKPDDTISFFPAISGG